MSVDELAEFVKQFGDMTEKTLIDIEYVVKGLDNLLREKKIKDKFMLRQVKRIKDKLEEAMKVLKDTLDIVDVIVRETEYESFDFVLTRFSALFFNAIEDLIKIIADLEKLNAEVEQRGKELLKKGNCEDIKQFMEIYFEVKDLERKLDMGVSKEDLEEFKKLFSK